jgi:hypothetical protein
MCYWTTCKTGTKVKLSLCLTKKGLFHECVWGTGCRDPHFLGMALVGGEGWASRPGRFTPGEKAHSTHWIGGCVDPRASLDDMEKILDPTGARTRPVAQPIASHCTDYCKTGITAISPVQNNISPTSGSMKKQSKKPAWIKEPAELSLFNPEDGGNMLLQNTGWLTRIQMTHRGS